MLVITIIVIINILREYVLLLFYQTVTRRSELFFIAIITKRGQNIKNLM